MNLLSGWSRKAVAALSAVEADVAAGEVSSIPCSLGKLFHSLFIRRQKRILHPKVRNFHKSLFYRFLLILENQLCNYRAGAQINNRSLRENSRLTSESQGSKNIDKERV